ncbi:MAG: AbrB/MazE/SpoVT family DNA-binding domain-containing protein [Gemmatimonadaceae bacterium]
MVLTSNTRVQGGSIVTSIPNEVARRLGANPGDPLYWIEDGAGRFIVTTVDPETVEALKHHENVIAQYREVFKALAE